MPRTKGGFTTRRRHKKVRKAARGYRGARSRRYKQSKEAVNKALEHQTRDRKRRKRDFRRLWIQRINAAARQHDVSYSRFIYGLKQADIDLNRKVLSDMAIRDPDAFAEVVELAKANL